MIFQELMKGGSFVMPLSRFDKSCQISAIFKIIDSTQVDLMILLLGLSMEIAIGFIFTF